MATQLDGQGWYFDAAVLSWIQKSHPATCGHVEGELQAGESHEWRQHTGERPPRNESPECFELTFMRIPTFL